MPPTTQVNGNRIARLLADLDITPLTEEQVSLMETFVSNVQRSHQHEDSGFQQDSD
jgi:hypothetical protein